MENREEQKRQAQEHYSEVMLDMGMPQEMSTYQELVGERHVSSPMVEITQPLHLGDGFEEIRRPEDLAEEL